jgi:hypothetical protein
LRVEGRAGSAPAPQISGLEIPRYVVMDNLRSLVEGDTYDVFLIDRNINSAAIFQLNNHFAKRKTEKCEKYRE